jgi:hypothetical protein
VLRFHRFEVLPHSDNTSSLQIPATVNKRRLRDVVQLVPAINDQALAVNPIGVSLKILPKAAWEQVNMLQRHHLAVNLHMATPAVVDPLEVLFQDFRKECLVD